MKAVLRTALAAFFIVFFPHFGQAQEPECYTLKEADALIDDGFMSIEASRQNNGFVQFLVKMVNGKFYEFTFFPPDQVCKTDEYIGDPRKPSAVL